MIRSTWFLIIICLLICTGCWDRKNIEDRGYILGIAIDAHSLEKDAEQKPPDKMKETDFGRIDMTTGKPEYDMTVQLPIVKKSPTVSASGGGGEGGGGESMSWQITQSGDSFLSMEREMESRVSLTLFYEHLQAIIISDDIARAGLDKMIDFFLRDREMRSNVGLFIAATPAKNLLEVIPRVEDHSATYLHELPTNSERNSRVVYKSGLGETVICIREGNDFVLPWIEATKDEIKMKGGALFKKGKMIGRADEVDIESINLIRNMYRGGVVVARRPDDKTGLIVMDVFGAKTKIKPIIQGDELKVDVYISIRGQYAEQIGSGGIDDLSDKFIEQCERAFSNEIEKQCNRTIRKMQKEYNIDVFQLNKLLRTQKPGYWHEIKEDWDRIYPDVEINVHVKSDVRLVGNKK